MWKNGSRYEGMWVDGKATGKGTFYYTDGDVYEGDQLEDRATGYGKYT